MDDISPKKLAQSIVEKHDRFIMGYSDEFDKMKQITMLTEKRDQLLHWVEENGSKNKYSKELTDTQTELEKLTSSFEQKTPAFYSELGEKIKQHIAAKEYWLGRIGEFKT